MNLTDAESHSRLPGDGKGATQVRERGFVVGVSSGDLEHLPLVALGPGGEFGTAWPAGFFLESSTPFEIADPRLMFGACEGMGVRQSPQRPALGVTLSREIYGERRTLANMPLVAVGPTAMVEHSSLRALRRGHISGVLAIIFCALDEQVTLDQGLGERTNQTTTANST